MFYSVHIMLHGTYFADDIVIFNVFAVLKIFAPDTEIKAIKHR